MQIFSENPLWFRNILKSGSIVALIENSDFTWQHVLDAVLETHNFYLFEKLDESLPFQAKNELYSPANIKKILDKFPSRGDFLFNQNAKWLYDYIRPTDIELNLELLRPYVCNIQRHVSLQHSWCALYFFLSDVHYLESNIANINAILDIENFSEIVRYNPFLRLQNDELIHVIDRGIQYLERKGLLPAANSFLKELRERLLLIPINDCDRADVESSMRDLAPYEKSYIDELAKKYKDIDVEVVLEEIRSSLLALYYEQSVIVDGFAMPHDLESLKKIWPDEKALDNVKKLFLNNTAHAAWRFLIPKYNPWISQEGYADRTYNSEGKIDRITSYYTKYEELICRVYLEAKSLESGMISFSTTLAGLQRAHNYDDHPRYLDDLDRPSCIFGIRAPLLQVLLPDMKAMLQKFLVAEFSSFIEQKNLLDLKEFSSAFELYAEDPEARPDEDLLSSFKVSQEEFIRQVPNIYKNKFPDYRRYIEELFFNKEKLPDVIFFDRKAGGFSPLLESRIEVLEKSAASPASTQSLSIFISDDSDDSDDDDIPNASQSDLTQAAIYGY